MMKRIVGSIGLAALCILSGVVGSALTRTFGTSAYTISYADFVSVMLTAISLLMTLLGFFIAILAFVGWQSVGSKVATEVKSYLADGFREGQPLHKMLVQQKDKAMFEGVRQIDEQYIQDDLAEEEEDQPHE